MKAEAWKRLVLIFVSLLSVTVAQAQTEPDFKGKTIRLVIGTSTGGGVDLYARLVGQYLGKHLPGEPVIVAQNMPGASSLAGGAAGGHTGTIMSYCHLLSGGMANLTFTFGGKAGFNYGVSPARESQRMSGYVASFGTNACLAPVSAGLLATGFEGGLGGWSGKGP